MKTTTGVIILAVICVVLVIVLVVTKQQSSAESHKKTEQILDFSNQWVVASENLNEHRQVNLSLSNDLVAVRKEASTLSNKVTEVSAKLADTEGSLKTAQQEIA